jgi:excisionase family DNA binding protein
VPMLTLGEASRVCGVPKSTVSRAIKSGRMSATRNDTGGYAIDPAELHRVYPFRPAEPAATPATGSPTGSAVHHATPRDSSDLDGATPPDHEVALRLATAEAELRGLRDMVEELRRARDDWQAQAQRLALTAPIPAAAPSPARVVPAVPIARPGWWPWRRRA